MADTTKVYAEHAQTCVKATGFTVEAESILCRVDGETGECVQHDMGDAETTEIRCEGCDAILWGTGKGA